jgi:hypothetical protein
MRLRNRVNLFVFFLVMAGCAKEQAKTPTYDQALQRYTQERAELERLERQLKTRLELSDTNARLSARTAALADTMTADELAGPEGRQSTELASDAKRTAAAFAADETRLREAIAKQIARVLEAQKQKDLAADR